MPGFRGTRRAGVRRIAAAAVPQTGRRGQTLVAENSEWPFIGVVTEGIVVRAKGHEIDRERILYEIFPHELFGVAEYFDRGLSNARIVVFSKTARIVKLPWDVVADVASRYPQLMTALGVVIAQRLASNERHVTVQGALPILARIARVLVPYAMPDRGLVPAAASLSTVTQSQIAAAAGTVKEVAARAIAELESRNVLRRERGTHPLSRSPSTPGVHPRAFVTPWTGVVAERFALLLGLSLFFGFAFEEFYSSETMPAAGRRTHVPAVGPRRWHTVRDRAAHGAAFIAGLLVSVRGLTRTCGPSMQRRAQRGAASSSRPVTCSPTCSAGGVDAGAVGPRGARGGRRAPVGFKRTLHELGATRSAGEDCNGRQVPDFGRHRAAAARRRTADSVHADYAVRRVAGRRRRLDDLVCELPAATLRVYPSTSSS